jgi:hypothetical protein
VNEPSILQLQSLKQVDVDLTTLTDDEEAQENDIELSFIQECAHQGDPWIDGSFDDF